jgi:hypothetical protein
MSGGKSEHQSFLIANIILRAILTEIMSLFAQTRINHVVAML